MRPRNTSLMFLTQTTQSGPVGQQDFEALVLELHKIEVRPIDRLDNGASNSRISCSLSGTISAASK